MNKKQDQQILDYYSTTDKYVRSQSKGTGKTADSCRGKKYRTHSKGREDMAL